MRLGLVVLLALACGCTTQQPSTPVEAVVMPYAGNRAWLSIGLTAVNPAVYGDSKPCPGADVDSLGLYGDAVAAGYKAVLLQNKTANWPRIKQEAFALVSNFLPNDLLVISMSGHGGWVVDDNGDEPSGMDSTLCFWDVNLRDDRFKLELLTPLSVLVPGLRVVLISDQCHAAGNFKAIVSMKPMRDVGFPLALIQIAGSREDSYSYGMSTGGTCTQTLRAILKRGNATWLTLFVDAKALMPSMQPIQWVEFGHVDDAFRFERVLR